MAINGSAGLSCHPSADFGKKRKGANKGWKTSTKGELVLSGERGFGAIRRGFVRLRERKGKGCVGLRNAMKSDYTGKKGGGINGEPYYERQLLHRTLWGEEGG